MESHGEETTQWLLKLLQENKILWPVGNFEDISEPQVTHSLITNRKTNVFLFH